MHPARGTTARRWDPPAGSHEATAIAHVAARADGPPLDRTLRVTLHFHPDRPYRGLPILEAMRRDGRYRSQFETGTTNGGRSAFPGGDRWRWESRLFGGAYDTAPPAARPKYGALDHRRRPTGAAPRFGSSFFRLRPDVVDRTTFCYPDSVFEPERFGVAEHMGLIRAARDDVRDPLDDAIEAHVHGPVRLDEDVEALVLDPCYAGGEVEALARRLPCAIEWHPGFVLSLDALRAHADYRGPGCVALGIALAVGGVLTPATIGDAVRGGRGDPQTLKRLWHCIARFGGCPPAPPLD